ncbi:P-loop containing nucleoside triphosphate hydrolase protein [Xylariaceae sp. FL0662B]|nr:P-loop containing nucleoside triphosphate hydrolase protein [Xylariaceae sp. FL0662B]
MAYRDDFEMVKATQARTSASASDSKQEPDVASPPKKEMKCQVKEYEARYELDGKRTVKELVPNTDADLQDEGKFALRLYKYYMRDGKTEKVQLEIQSPYIRDALRTVIQKYPDQNFTGNITLTGNAEHSALACLFHYRKELREYGETLENGTAKQHVFLVVDFVEKEFRRDIRRFEANIEATTPCAEFKDLWMLFKPGDLVYGGQGPDQFIHKIAGVAFNPGGIGMCPHWIISAKAFVHNGSTFGYTNRQLQIKAFEGYQEVLDLPLFPFQFHPDQSSVQQKLVRRGQKYCSLIGIQYHAYSGAAIAVDRQRTVSAMGRANDTFPQVPIELHGRIILDCKSFIEERTDNDIKMHEVRNIEKVNITEEDYMLCHFMVAGFSLSEKRWAWFCVDLVKDIDFDDEAFDALLLPSKQKRLVRALTSKHTSSQGGFDDLIQGKGKGCIFLLHGEPGIGKTFTAESLADDIKRPLYVMMSGELGSDVKSVDKNLKNVLKLVTRWNAVLLIDEADVFLEKRSSRDLARNSLVSIFLRTLEYFSGVMFLTTNRITSFDPAFQSRIHLALKYHPLDSNARESLWRLFLQRTSGFNAENWPPEVLKELAAVDVNGRQIKNTVSTAYALALAEDQNFGPEQVRDVLETVDEFRMEFNKETEIHEDPSEEGALPTTFDLGLPEDA